MHQNKRIRYLSQEYEIFWTTQYARHISANYNQDRLHDIHIDDIAQLLEYYDAVNHLRDDRYVFLNWNNRRSCVYEIHVYLEGGSRNRPGRCVVITGYRSNKQQYIALAAEAQKKP